MMSAIMCRNPHPSLHSRQVLQLQKLHGSQAALQNPSARKLPSNPPAHSKPQILLSLLPAMEHTSTHRKLPSWYQEAAELASSSKQRLSSSSSSSSSSCQMLLPMFSPAPGCCWELSQKQKQKQKLLVVSAPPQASLCSRPAAIQRLEGLSMLSLVHTASPQTQLQACSQQRRLSCSQLQAPLPVLNRAKTQVPQCLLGQALLSLSVIQTPCLLIIMTSRQTSPPAIQLTMRPSQLSPSSNSSSKLLRGHPSPRLPGLYTQTQPQQQLQRQPRGLKCSLSCMWWVSASLCAWCWPRSWGASWKLPWKLRPAWDSTWTGPCRSRAGC